MVSKDKQRSQKPTCGSERQVGSTRSIAGTARGKEPTEKKMSLQEQMAAAAAAASACGGERLDPMGKSSSAGPDFRNIVKRKSNNKEEDTAPETVFKDMTIGGGSNSLVEMLD